MFCHLIIETSREFRTEFQMQNMRRAEIWPEFWAFRVPESNVGESDEW